jgi:hypothetical protein
MDFSNICPRNSHPFLIWLGNLKENWLNIYAKEGKRTSMEIRWDYVKNSPGYKPFDKYAQRIMSDTQMSLLTLDTLSSGIAKGPKIFQPTSEQFDSMQNVDLNIPISSYKQPYPSMVVKFPRVGALQLAQKTNVDPTNVPMWAMVRNRLTSEGHNFIFILHHFPQSRNDIVYIFQERPEFRTIEDALKSWVLDEKSIHGEHAFGETSSRAIINLMLMLTHYGHKDVGPLDPKQYDKHRKAKLHHYAVADFRSIEMKQTIIIRKVEGLGHGEQPIPSGVEIAPHWRRGHWREQHWGAGNLHTKTIFIRPVLVRADRVVGSLAETNVTLMAKN